MSYSVIAHLSNQEPISGEIDDMPEHTATFVILKSPHGRNDTVADWLAPGTNSVLIPMSHLISLEISTMLTDQEYHVKYGMLSSNAIRPR